MFPLVEGLMPTEPPIFENAAGALVKVAQVTFSNLLPAGKLFLAVVGELNSLTPLQGLLKHGSSSFVW